MFGSSYVARLAVIDWEQAGVVICAKCLEAVYGEHYGADLDEFYAWTCEGENIDRFEWVYRCNLDEDEGLCCDRCNNVLE